MLHDTIRFSAPKLLAASALGLVLAAPLAQAADTLTLYGNIDIRQINLAFRDMGRIKNIRVHEGDPVKAGAVLGELDQARFQDTVHKAENAVAAQKEIVAKLLAGTRPQKIQQAREHVTAAKAGVQLAEITLKRIRSVERKGYVPPEKLDEAKAKYDQAVANLAAAEAGLNLALQGPQTQDIAAAKYKLASMEAELALAKRVQTDSRLIAPADGVVENRVLEPGDIASPQAPALILALNNPVWARAYLPEPALGKVREGMRAWIESDSFPGKRFPGWVGFISPTAQFTPQPVQTPSVRTTLSYRVRIYACNPDGKLRLGMPVTVQIPLNQTQPVPASQQRCAQ
ncbi:efflux RND transporter periplasmic adaptor subunit [Acidihalobacter ferrooxydans]|uniref:Hemolysin D n=1 Tax=Acidihalobacter ferrooxydans TaxID=1765967 RepID=A0A1P8UJI2_9GAMM|nr:efflux RND transporter periplasmic adaptor subunit [Acidihalobacter ferrooxydans]APZ43995.1 hemolysin D [Acidihalobacter ferrooxydans]